MQDRVPWRESSSMLLTQHREENTSKYHGIYYHITDTTPVTPDPKKGLEEELEDLKEQSDTYMKVMFGLVGGVVLAMLILLYVAYSYNQSNNHLKMKLRYMTDDDGEGERS